MPGGLLSTDLLKVNNATVMRPAIGGKRKTKKSRKSRRGLSTETVLYPECSNFRAQSALIPHSRRGGFYPAVMGPIGTSGVYLLGPALTNAYKLLRRKSKRRSNRRSRRSV